MEYNFNMYENDVRRIFNSMHSCDHIVALYRGSLPIATHLSNLTGNPLSIVRMQRYDGESEFDIMYDAGLADSKRVLLIDDILDSGITMNTTQSALSVLFPKLKIQSVCLVGHKNDDNVTCLREHDGNWVDFWWEDNGLDERMK
jgi:hypoxanthine phosphoribosyltransferase